MLAKNLYEMISVVAADATLSFTESSAFSLIYYCYSNINKKYLIEIF